MVWTVTQPQRREESVCVVCVVCVWGGVTVARVPNRRGKRGGGGEGG